MTGATASKGQQVSDLLVRLGAALSTTAVTLSPPEVALAREGLCLLAAQDAATAARTGDLAATAAARPHAVAPMAVHDRMGRPCTAATRASYPLNATCGVCNGPAQCNTGPGEWYHLGRAAGWPVPQQPLANDDPPGRQRDQLCPEHGRYCVHL